MDKHLDDIGYTTDVWFENKTIIVVLLGFFPYFSCRFKLEIFCVVLQDGRQLKLFQRPCQIWMNVGLKLQVAGMLLASKLSTCFVEKCTYLRCMYLIDLN